MKTLQEVHSLSAGLLLNCSPHSASPWPFLAPLHLFLFKNLLFPELILHLLLFQTMKWWLTDLGHLWMRMNEVSEHSINEEEVLAKA
jgi:hypothetical protein